MCIPSKTKTEISNDHGRSLAGGNSRQWLVSVEKPRKSQVNLNVLKFTYETITL